MLRKLRLSQKNGFLIQKNEYYVKGALHGKIFMKINTILKHMLY